MTWKIEKNRVYGNGKSFQLQNKTIAEDLYRILDKYDQLEKQVIGIQMTVKVLNKETDNAMDLIK